MAVLKMQRITVCALKKDRKAILEKIQSMGVLQVDPHSPPQAVSATTSFLRRFETDRES